MAERVTSTELRFRFVEGWLTGGVDPEDGSVEVGDYTPFGMEVTGATIKDKFDKIAEAFYRASKAQFTSNTLSVSGAVSAGVTTGTISPRVMYSSGGGLSDNYLMSGYWTFDQTPFDVYAAALPFLGEQYTEEYWDSGYAGTGTFRDINGRESGMLLANGDGTEQPQWNRPEVFIDGGGVRTAFTWLSVSAAGTLDQPSIPIPWVTDDSMLPDVIYETLELSVGFSGRIGVVYGGAVGELYHPDNRFFLEMAIRGSTSFFLFAETYFTGYVATDATYTMKLSTGDLSCKLTSTEAALAGNLDHEAVEWWPSAKNNPAAPVWNTATGAKL
jgi:hypothetical protein